MDTTHMDNEIGRVLGDRYRLVAPIGIGASARVFLADDITLRRRVAVKILHPALAADDSFLRRFRAEAQAAASLNHPHVLGVYDWGHDDVPFLVSEYLAGGSLHSMLAAGHRLTPSQALLIGLEASRGLEYAHGRGLVHRDIKPANLLFGDDGRLRIADFGLARALAEAGWTEPNGSMVGTARYAAPEQAKGERIGPAADVYALALVLNEVVSGEVPFTADTTVATLMARVDKDLDPSALLGPLRGPVAQAGQADPALRPEAGAFAGALLAAAGGLARPGPLPLVGPVDLNGGGMPEPTEFGTILGSPAADSESDTKVVERTRHTVPDEDDEGRRRWPWIMAVLLMIAGAAGGGAYAWYSSLPKSAVVPELVGMTESEAAAAVADNNWVLVVNDVREIDSQAGNVVRTEPVAGTDLKENEELLLFVSIGEPLVLVPDPQGLTLEDYTAELERQELVAGEVTEENDEVVPAGVVIRADLPLGLVEIERGTTVNIVVSLGPIERIVPEIPGDGSLESARAALGEVRLIPRDGEEFSETVPAGEIIRFEPPAGTQLAADGEVFIIVSSGPEPRAVPNVAGLSIEAAQEKLVAAGFVAGELVGPLGREVIGTDPERGSVQNRGVTVDIITGVRESDG